VWKAFWDLVNSLPVPQETKVDLFSCLERYLILVTEQLKALDTRLAAFCAGNDEFRAALHLLIQRDQNQKKGPHLKKERVQRRCQEIHKAVEQGITDDENLFRFMQDNHRDLIRKGKKGFISVEQMMRSYRAYLNAVRKRSSK
jgi:hypothetical protein